MRSLPLLLLLTTSQVFAAERLGRGLVALECERGVFLSWRLLATDPENVRFHIFRREENSLWEPITNEPLTVTNFTDTKVERGKTYRYQVRAFVGNSEIGRSKDCLLYTSDAADE